MEPFGLLISKVGTQVIFLGAAPGIKFDIQEVGEDRRGRGEMNCRNLGRGVGEEIFQETLIIFIV